MSMIIGLTGGIASGKSTVASMLRKMGIVIIDADVEARLAVKKGELAYNQIIKVFGHELIMADGEIDRQKLGSIIFHNDQKRLLLNQIVHPEVRKRMSKLKEVAIEKGANLVILDIPLLFESKLTDMVDKTILVYVDRRIQVERLMERNGLSYQEAEARINVQMPLSEKISLADAIIDNNGSLIETKRQLDEILLRWGIKIQ